VAPLTPPKTLLVALIAVLVCSLVACEPAAEVRVYDAPKSESTFVAGPLSGQGNRSNLSGSGSGRNPLAPGQVQPGQVQPGQVASGPRRILGAIIPTEQGCYFIKATDSPDRLEPLVQDVRTMVESFAIDTQTGLPSNKLPDGWQLNPRNDIALAELISPEATGRIKFTVTALAMPSENWDDYLLSNINRWRGQLKLQELTSDSLKETLVEIPRPASALSSYLFDAIGTGTGGMSPSSGSPPTVPQSSRQNSPVPAGPDPSTSGRPELEYRLPQGWSVGQGSQFRLATLNVESSQGRGEVTVSMATDNPQANTMMWVQQISKQANPATLEPLAEKTVQDAEKFEVGDKQATLYQVRSSDEPTAPSLLVVSLPTEKPEMNLFVKLIGENQLTTSEKDNLIQFVQSLKIK